MRNRRCPVTAETVGALKSIGYPRATFRGRPAVAETMLDNLALLLARIFIAGLFIWDGTVMVRNVEGTLGYMDVFGVPGFLLPAAVLLQIGGGILIVLGWFTRPVALLFAGFALATAFLFHTNFASHGEAIHFAKDIAISGGFLALFVAGPGRFSVDERGE